MIHGSRSRSLDPGLRRYTFLGGKADPLIFRGGQIRLFWCQNGALLWRADPSFKNSVTGSGSIAKYSKYSFLHPKNKSLKNIGKNDT
jgi:hypothetical protein